MRRVLEPETTRSPRVGVIREAESDLQIEAVAWRPMDVH